MPPAKGRTEECCQWLLPPGRWYDKLPAEVKDSAHCGAPCPLFWPPAPDHPSVLALLEEEQEAAGLGPAADGGLLSPRARAWQPMSVVQSLRVAVQVGCRGVPGC